MSDFRRLFYALALVALLAGLTVPASAQAAPFQSIANARVPPDIRAEEGWTELVGDLTLNYAGRLRAAARRVVRSNNLKSVVTNWSWIYRAAVLANTEIPRPSKVQVGYIG
jgi:hypothetical protein